MSEMQQDDQEQARTTQEATNLGWVPADQWRGDPDQHVSAEEFLERGEKILPIALQNNQRLQTELSELKQSVRELNQLSIDAQRRARKAGYDKAVSERTEAQAQAIKEGDADKFRKAGAEITQLQKQQQQESVADQQGDANQSLAQVARTFTANNPWMNQHFELNETLEKATKFLMTSRPDLQADPTGFMEEAKKIVMQQHPNHAAFGGGGGAGQQGGGGDEGGGAPVNDGGSRQVSGRRPGKGVNRLPADARAAGERYVKQGLYKDLAEYSATYFEGDDQ